MRLFWLSLVGGLLLSPTLLDEDCGGGGPTPPPTPTPPPPTAPPTPVSDIACQTQADCAAGQSCVGHPQLEGTSGCCVSTQPLPGEGATCTSTSPCGEGLACISGQCSPGWMAATYAGPANFPVPGGGVTTSILVSCQATVPVDALLSLRLEHPRLQDLRVTMTDAGLEMTTVIHDRQDLPEDVLEVRDFRILHPGDSRVNGLWELKFEDYGSGAGGRLDSSSLYITSRWD